MMTVVTISSEVDPVQELTIRMNSCADGEWGQHETHQENCHETSPRQTPHS